MSGFYVSGYSGKMAWKGGVEIWLLGRAEVEDEMKKEEFYFTSRNGRTKLHAVRYSPEQLDSVRGVLQIVHGMAEYVERYDEFAEYFTSRGIVVTGEDHMGHGKSVNQKQGGKYGYFCQQDPATVVVQDVHQLQQLTRKLYPHVPYVLLGHSMGSFITRNYMYCYGKGISGVILMGTGMQSPLTLYMAKALVGIQKVFCGSRHTSKLIDKLAFGRYNRRISNPRTSFDWLSRDAARVDQYLADPLCGFVFTVNGFDTLFELIARLYRPGNLKRIPKELPVFMLSGKADPVGGYGKGVRRAYASLKKAGLRKIKLKLYAGGRHELLNEINRKEVMQDIYDWMKGTVL